MFKIKWWRILSKILPKRVITGRFDNQPYLVRYKLFKIPFLWGIFIHKFVRSDDDIVMHDHPWNFYHKILEGAYLEENEDGIHLRGPGYSSSRKANYRHRIDLLDTPNNEVWTLFIKGRKRREWGFICKDGRWRQWRNHIKNRNRIEDDC